jgi:hypothetical protein
VVRLAALTLFLLGTVTTLTRYGIDANRWYDGRYNWQAREYRALSHLHADFTLASFDRSLGPPLIQQD